MTTPQDLLLIQGAQSEVYESQQDHTAVLADLGAAEMACMSNDATGMEEEKAKAKAKLEQIVQRLQQIIKGLCP